VKKEQCIIETVSGFGQVSEQRRRHSALVQAVGLPTESASPMSTTASGQVQAAAAEVWYRRRQRHQEEGCWRRWRPTGLRLRAGRQEARPPQRQGLLADMER